MKDIIIRAIQLAPEVIEFLTPKARLLAGITIKAARDRRTWQGKEEKELQSQIGRLMDEYWGITTRNIAAGDTPTTDEVQKRLKAILQQRLADIAAQNAEERAAEIGIGFDPAAVDVAAEAWARDYSYSLIKGIDDTTRELVANAVTMFVNTPGMTNRDLKLQLESAFGEVRAEMIAITEVTRAFSAGEMVYQNLLSDAGIEVQREWLTSEDEKVCPICGFLDRKRVDPGEMFIDENGIEYDNPPAHPRCRCAVQTRIK